MWARFDDKYYGNAKIVAAQREGRDLHMASVIWVAGHAPTTGLIPKSLLQRIACLADLKPRLHRPTAEVLVRLNLWEDYDADNWLLHDFRVYLPKDPTGPERSSRYRHGKNRDANRDEPVTVTALRARVDPTRPDPSSEDLSVFTEWQTSTGRAQTHFTAPRRRVITARRREGYTQDDLLDAVRGWPNDPWEGRSQQNEFCILLRDGGQVEKFAGFWRNGRPLPIPTNRNQAAAADWDRLSRVALP